MTYTISSTEVDSMDEEKTESLKCPECGKTTYQILRGWKGKWLNYRCGHCNKRYTEHEENDN